jgi:hypothetical protein
MARAHRDKIVDKLRIDLAREFESAEMLIRLLVQTHHDDLAVGGPGAIMLRPPRKRSSSGSGRSSAPQITASRSAQSRMLVGVARLDFCRLFAVRAIIRVSLSHANLVS